MFLRLSLLVMVVLQPVSNRQFLEQVVPNLIEEFKDQRMGTTIAKWLLWGNKTATIVHDQSQNTERCKASIFF